MLTGNKRCDLRSSHPTAGRRGKRKEKRQARQGQKTERKGKKRNTRFEHRSKSGVKKGGGQRSENEEVEQNDSERVRR